VIFAGYAVPRGMPENLPHQVWEERQYYAAGNAALASYYQSIAFSEQLAKTTRQNRRAILEQFRNAHGDKRVALMPCQRCRIS